MAADAQTLMNLFPDVAGDKLAVVVPDQGPRWTYAFLRQQIESLRDHLRRGGIGPGDVVSIVLPNGLEFLATFQAVTWARAIAAPLNPAYKVEEFRFYMEDAGAKVVVVPPGNHPAREAAAQLNLPVWEARLDSKGHAVLERPQGAPADTQAADPPRGDDVALFLHTSGTTSRPKGVPLTHANLCTSLRNIADTYALSPDDVSLIVMPLFHVHGLLGATL
ncbi:MAG TPA: AMP-binding protein, partial [Isosphaeraceae bacterium]|nr:AMP-binding protein [Isosphaeraceae bacterium]